MNILILLTVSTFIWSTRGLGLPPDLVVLDTIVPNTRGGSLSATDPTPEVRGIENIKSAGFERPITPLVCTGTFLNNSTVLTSATCLNALNIYSLLPQTAKYPRLNWQGQSIAPLNVFYHPRYPILGRQLAASETLPEKNKAFATYGWGIVVFPQDTATKLGVKNFANLAPDLPQTEWYEYDGLTKKELKLSAALSIKDRPLPPGTPLFDHDDHIVAIANHTAADGETYFASVGTPEIQELFKVAIGCTRKPCAENFPGSMVDPPIVLDGMFEAESINRCRWLNVVFERGNPDVVGVSVQGVGTDACKTYHQTFTDCHNNVCIDPITCTRLEFDKDGFVLLLSGTRTKYKKSSNEPGATFNTKDIPVLGMDLRPDCARQNNPQDINFCDNEGRKFSLSYQPSNYLSADKLCKSHGMILPGKELKDGITAAVGNLPYWTMGESQGEEQRATICRCALYQGLR